MSWAVSKIDEVAEVVTKGTTPTTYGMPFTDSGVNFIKAEALNGDSSLDNSGFAFVSESTHEKLTRSILAEDDILVTIAGAQVGRCGIVRAEHLPANTNQAVGIIRVLREKANPRFVYYFFKNPHTFRMFQGIGGQAAQPNINLAVLKRFDLPLPDLRVQDAIVEVLSAYDDLIEINRRRIALLEEAARLLYREWFVHFRFPGHEHVKIVEGIPAGWEQVRVADKFDTTSGGTPSRQNPDFFSGSINWVKTQELNERPIFETSEKITEEAIERSSAKLLPDQTLLVSIYGNTNIGRTGSLAVPGSSNQACVALLPKRRKEDWIYAQLWLQKHREQIIGLAQGAAQTNISQETLRGLTMIWPSSRLLDTFLDSVLSSYQQIECLCLQNVKLVQARDLLLPRLMNGEIAV